MQRYYKNIKRRYGLQLQTLKCRRNILKLSYNRNVPPPTASPNPLLAAPSALTKSPLSHLPILVIFREVDELPRERVLKVFPNTYF